MLVLRIDVGPVDNIAQFRVVDLAWALGFALSTLLYACLTRHSDVRHWTIGLMVAIWSLRLAWHLGVRFVRTYPKEDPRYAAIKESMTGNVQAKMLLVFLWQAAVLTLLTAPIAITLCDRQTDLGVLQFLAIGFGSLHLSESPLLTIN